MLESSTNFYGKIKNSNKSSNYIGTFAFHRHSHLKNKHSPGRTYYQLKTGQPSFDFVQQFLGCSPNSKIIVLNMLLCKIF